MFGFIVTHEPKSAFILSPLLNIRVLVLDKMLLKRTFRMNREFGVINFVKMCAMFLGISELYSPTVFNLCENDGKTYNYILRH